MKRLTAIALIASALAHGTPDGPRYYYIGPWVLDTDETGMEYWHAPEHTVGLVDLRGNNVNGVGFFSTDAPIVGYTEFGSDLNAQMKPSQVAAWNSALGTTETSGGSGIEGATVRAYLKSEYDAGTYTVRATTTTLADGSWGPVYLSEGLTYTLVFHKPGVYGPDTQEITP